MAIRLIALDLDGTALDTGKRIRPATRAVVAEARARGIDTVLVTGRHHRMAAAYHAQLDLSTPIIACNGACVFDLTANRAIVARALAVEQAKAIINVVRQHDVGCHLYSAAAVHHEGIADSAMSYIGTTSQIAAEMRQAFTATPSFEHLIDGGCPILKIVVFNVDRPKVEACLAEIEPMPGLSCEWSWSFGCDVTLAGNTKGRTLIDWAATQGVAPEEIIAFGDNHNDITMLTAVGTGVAMGNAEPEVQAAANWTTTDNDSDAIADTLHRFVL